MYGEGYKNNNNNNNNNNCILGTVRFFSHIPTTSYGSSPLAGIVIKPLTPYPSSPALCPSATTSSPTLALYSVILPSHFQLYPTCCKTRRPTEIALRKRNIRTWLYRNYYVYEYIGSARQNGIRVRGVDQKEIRWKSENVKNVIWCVRSS